MIIDEENIRVQYESTAESPIVAGDVLPFPYRFTEKEQLNAVLLDGTKLIYKQDYTVGETSITLSVDIPIGDTITIYRSTPLDQGSEFPQEAKFNSKKIEDALDKLTMQNQEQREALGRALKLPLTASTDLSDLALPNPDPNKSVKWNSDGTALVNTDFDPDLALALTENFKNQAQQAAVEAENQRNVATEQATIATQQAGIATEKTIEVVQAKEEAVTTIKDTETNSLTKINSEFNKANEWFEKLNAIPYIPVGTILPTTGAIDESLGYQRYANGQLIANVSSQAPDLVKFLKFQEAHAPNLLCSETEWQTALTLSAIGQVGKYVWNKEKDSVRIPRIVNIQGMMDMNYVGNMVEAGLPNITGHFGSGTLTKKANTTDNSTNMLNVSGAILPQSTSGGSYLNDTTTSCWFVNGSLTFNASASNPIYGNSNTVQEESILYPYVLQIATGVQYKTPVQNELMSNNPFFFGYYQFFEVAPNNISWLKSAAQWNSAKTHGDYYNWLAEERTNPKDIPTRANVIKVGNVIENDGVLSGFSTSIYATLPQLVTLGNNFELKTEFIIKSKPTSTTYSGLFTIADKTIFSLAIDTHGDYPVLNTGYGNGTNWVGRDILGTKQLEYGKKYKVRVRGTESGYIVAIAENDSDYVDDITITDNISLASGIMQVGVSRPRDNAAETCSIYLNESYINIDGQRWWSGMKSKVRLHTEDYDDYDWVINPGDQTFRLPLKVLGASGSAVVGNGMTLGLTDGTTNVGLGTYMGQYHFINSNTGWYGKPVGTSTMGETNSAKDISVGVTPDPTKSGIETSTQGLSLYFYVGGVAKNEHLVDVGRIEEKVDTLIPDNSSLISSYGMPANRGINLTLGASEATYIAPANGWFSCRINSSTVAHNFLQIANTSKWWITTQSWSSSTHQDLQVYLQAAKGDVVRVVYNDKNNGVEFKFVYAQGEV